MSIDDSTTALKTIYFIQAGRSGPVKIGQTNKPILQRLSGLQSGNHERLYILATIPDSNDTYERSLHRQFRPLHIRGEWFRNDPELLRFIDLYATPFVHEDEPVRSRDPLPIIYLESNPFPAPERVPVPSGPGLAGRPRHADDPELRARMVACATDWKVIRAPLRNVAALYGVHANTVKNWARQALRLKGPDGDRLRALVSLAPDLHDGGGDPPDE
jgi:hypothetical protein